MIEKKKKRITKSQASDLLKKIKEECESNTDCNRCRFGYIDEWRHSKIYQCIFTQEGPPQDWSDDLC